MNTYIYAIFEFAINLFQSFLITHFLVSCFGAGVSNGKPYVEYISGSVSTLIYLEILNKLTAFENLGVFLYLIISMIFSVTMLAGKVIEKLFYNIIVIVIIVLSTMSGAGLVSFITGISYSELMLNNIWERYIALVVVQIILSIMLIITLKVKKSVRNVDYKYLGTLAVIPAISVVICCILFFGTELIPRNAEIIVSFLGIVIINVVSLYLLIIEHKLYEKHLLEENIISAYEQKEKDVNAIKEMKLEMDKLQHDSKKIYILLDELLENGEYVKAKDFLSQYIVEKKIKSINLLYCDNIILNYLLNRKQSQCNDNGISMKCFVLGIIDGIKDVDLYILLENLIDNAIEAAKKTGKKRVDFSMYADQGSINIEIGNSVEGNIKVERFKMETTKEDKKRHGYGLKNVEDVVGKYKGVFRYDKKMDDYIVCYVYLDKMKI